MTQTIQLIIFYVVIMLVLFLPTFLSNKKKRKQQQDMLNGLKIGDKVVTIGGIKGEIVNVLTDSIEMRIDKNVKMTVLKSAISNVSK